MDSRLSATDWMFSKNHAMLAPSIALSDHFNLISFLAVMQFCDIDLLPIKWQPARDSLGKGGTAHISQSLLNAQLSFAFKRVFLAGTMTVDEIRRCLNEILVLSHPVVRPHPNIIRLEACCLELLPNRKLSPVLIFEKMPMGNLEVFRESTEARNVPLLKWLEICTAIGQALMTLHNNNIVHGDVKPSNILISYDAQHDLLAKLADFGYSTVSPNIDSFVHMPKSEHWVAPEWHPSSFRVTQARKMDIYSFGLVCYWQLVRDVMVSRHSRTWKDIYDKLISTGFDGQQFAQALALPENVSTRMQKFFKLTLAINPADRSSNWEQLLSLLIGEKQLYKHTDIPVDNSRFDLHPQFRISEWVQMLSHVDSRIRTALVDELHNSQADSACSVCRENNAFQLAFCFKVPFGVVQTAGESLKWLNKSGKSSDELEAELQSIRDGESFGNDKYKQSWLNEIADQFIESVIFSHEYRDIVGLEREKLKSLYINEFEGCGENFGTSHQVTINLARTMATILNSWGLFGEAETLQMQLLQSLAQQLTRLKVLSDLSITCQNKGELARAERISCEVSLSYEAVLGRNHLGTLDAMCLHAGIQFKRGHRESAISALRDVLANKERILGPEHTRTLTTMARLSALLYEQKRWEEASYYQERHYRSIRQALGDEHESTWQSLLNLAAIKGQQGFLDEEEKLTQNVISLRKTFLGTRHYLTLTAQSNLAVLYRSQKRYQEESEILIQVLAERKAVLGEEHDDTLITAQMLADNYRKRQLFAEAASLHKEVCETRVALQENVFANPRVFQSLTSLAWIRFEQGQVHEAQEMQLRTQDDASLHLNTRHETFLECRRQLALMYGRTGRFEESRAIHANVFNVRKRALGGSHPDTKRSLRDMEEMQAMSKNSSATVLPESLAQLAYGPFIINPIPEYSSGDKPISSWWNIDSLRTRLDYIK